MNNLSRAIRLGLTFGAMALLGSCTSTNPSIVLADGELTIHRTPAGVEFVRTPERFFDDLPDWDFTYRYVEIGGLRQAYIDEGPADGEPILLLHGQPAWSYLYRFMIPELAERGYRVIAMDHLGMGRSDKPIDTEYHTFLNHVHRLNTFIDRLDLANLTVFMQDWGSVIGLYVAGSDLSRFDRIILGNGGLPVIDEPYELPHDLERRNRQFDRMINMIPDEQFAFFDEEGNSVLPVNDGSEDAGGFGQWMGYALYYEGFQASRMVEGLTYYALTPDERAAYDAPFPARITMAGPRTFPSLLNDLVGITQDKLNALTEYEKPFLTIFGGNDPGLAGDTTQEWVIANIPGANGQNHWRFADGSHFLQDDKGYEIAVRVDEFIRQNPVH